MVDVLGSMLNAMFTLRLSSHDCPVLYTCLGAYLARMDELKVDHYFRAMRWNQGSVVRQ